MLRRLFVFLFGQRRRPDLAALLADLRAHGVTKFRDRHFELELSPPVQVLPAGQHRGNNMPSDAELLFGESEADLRKQGLY